MLTSKCKLHIKETLKERYAIDCYRIVPFNISPHNHYVFTLFCMINNRVFEMQLTLSRYLRFPSVLKTEVMFQANQSHNDQENFIDDYDFTIQINSDHTDFIDSLSHQMHNNKITDTVKEVNNLFTIGNNNKYYFFYSKVILMSGIMTRDKGAYTIKKISDDSYFVANLCSSFESKHPSDPKNNTELNVFMYGNTFGYRKHTPNVLFTSEMLPSHDSFVSINKESIEQFKKDIFQILFFAYSERFNFKIAEVSDIELRNLDLEDFIKYIEVQQMINI
jgi:hypothetical protein